MIKRNLLIYRAKRHSKKNKSPRASVDYKHVSEIGILFTIDSKDKHEEVKSLVKRLETDGKNVQVLAFLPKKRENHEFLFDFFTEKDVSIWGQFTLDTIDSFINRPFDYIFYIDEKSNLLLRNILAMSKAKCRISKSDEDNAPFSEMMVHLPSNSSSKQLIDEMYRYTKMLS